MNKTGIAASALVALLAAGTAGAWYTGSRVEGALTEALQRTNEQFLELFPDGELRMELSRFERGLFSSQAEYRIVVDDKGDETLLLALSDRIEHGPFPLTRLSRLQLMPVMAYSQTSMKDSEVLGGLFNATGGHSPMNMTSVMGYDQHIEAQLTLVPMTLQDDGLDMTFSGFNADLSTDKLGEKIVLSGSMEALTLDIGGLMPIRMSMNDLVINMDRTQNADGLYLGSSHLDLASMAFTLSNRKTLELLALRSTDTLLEQDGQLTSDMNFDLGSVNYAGQTLGSMSSVWRFSRLDSKAVAELNRFYNQVMTSVQTGADIDDHLDDVQDVVAQLLAGKPRLALESLDVRTANGESRLSLAVELAAPESFELEDETLLRQIIARVDGQLQLSKPMLRDLVSYKGLFQPELSSDELAMEAEVLIDMLEGMAQASKLARVEGDDLRTDLLYAEGQLEINGNPVALDELDDLFASALPSAPQPDIEQMSDAEIQAEVERLMRDLEAIDAQ